MRFLVDAQLPPALADWLVERGYEAKAVRDLGLREAMMSPFGPQPKMPGGLLSCRPNVALALSGSE